MTKPKRKGPSPGEDPENQNHEVDPSILPPIEPEVLPPEGKKAPGRKKPSRKQPDKAASDPEPGSIDALVAEESKAVVVGEVTPRDVERLFEKIQNPSETLSAEELKVLSTIAVDNTAKVKVALGAFFLDRLSRNRKTGSAMDLAVQRLTEMIPTLDVEMLLHAIKLLGDIDDAQANRITGIVHGGGVRGGKEGDVNNNLIQILNVRSNPTAPSSESSEATPLVDGKNPLTESLKGVNPDNLARILRLTQTIVKKAQDLED